jgi:L-aspartate oxidase
MSRGAGVIRTGAGLARLLADIGELESACGPALPLIAARLVAEGALARRESRGAHFRSDYPAAAAPARSRVILPPAAGAGDRRFAPSVAA